MARNNRLVGRYTKMNQVNPPSHCRTMQITEQTFRVLKEHAIKYYSNPTYDEMLVNLVKFYEQNDGPTHNYE